MRSIMSYVIVAAMVTLLLGGSTAMAKDKDKTRGPGDRPSGWEQGEKTGWEGELPPGLEKKVDEEDGVKEKKKKKDKKKKVKKKKDGVDEEVGEDVDEEAEEEELKESEEEEEEGEVKQEEEGLEENEQGQENLEKETVKGSEKAVGKKRGLFKRLFGGGEE